VLNGSDNSQYRCYWKQIDGVCTNSSGNGVVSLTWRINKRTKEPRSHIVRVLDQVLAVCNTKMLPLYSEFTFITMSSSWVPWRHSRAPWQPQHRPSCTGIDLQLHAETFLQSSDRHARLLLYLWYRETKKTIFSKKTNRRKMEQISMHLCKIWLGHISRNVPSYPRAIIARKRSARYRNLTLDPWSSIDVIYREGCKF